MSSVNKVILLGNVGKDPEIRQTQSGKKIAHFSLATSEAWRDKGSGEKREKTEWTNVVVFNEGLSGVVEKYVRKGSKIYVSGQLQTRKYTDQSGIERYSTEVVLQGFNAELVLLDKPAAKQESEGAAYAKATGRDPAGYDDLDDEMPF